jgi:type IV secretion system protein VirB9
MKFLKSLVIFLIFMCFVSKHSFASDFPVTTDSRIKTIVFNENEVYQLKFHYGFQSFIEFSEDEEIELISLGEAFPWRLTPVRKRLFVRPLQINVKTNLTVVTTKRTYQFEISADAYDGRADEELIYSVRFFYPEKEQKIPTVKNVKDIVEDIEGKKVDEKEAKEKSKALNFNYSFAGDDKEITPVKVFDDGLFTYFEFPDNNLIIPSIQSVDTKGKETSLNYRIDGNYVVIDTLQMQYSLRLGSSLVCIFNNTMM